ncbi:hypothetical protein HYQ45_010065 [Verticillium longisporum]|uniref:DUF202 domain-containing protein n=2 Tax=Verticillium TaxID=1036719 RepID=A0A2J8CCE9_VERDA|nr:hypothetical protein VdG2_05646 [Verticillium dahliae VDG2]KAG7131373.1 hypothetical protein HYQ45_010065 [Verticillium longisporum]KAH6700432.1 hypothetical protein EV126DRAFT_35133 [Verticillium dahliae]PNH34694.1 hypothetical protein BJF96_g2096 [Verticillium dahliae]PNH46393.1 hypothetical protein VD0004_g1743 [Verticillium dahliae]
MASERHDTAASAATAAGPDAAAVAPPSPSIPSRRPSTSASRISRTVSFDQVNLDAIQHTSSHPQPPVHRPSANTNDRISNILEDARNRSETMSSPEHRRILESDREDEGQSSADERTGIFTRGADRNYQSISPMTATPVLGPRVRKAPSTRRSTASSRIDLSAPDGRPDQDADATTADTPEVSNTSARRARKPEKKSTWHGGLFSHFQSIELENKGSVARDHLALERTFLAWLRTSLAFASIGIAVTQLFRLNTSLPNSSGDKEDAASVTLRRLGKPLGATFLGISIVILFLGYHRYFHVQRWIIAGKFPASRGTIIAVAFVAFAVMIASLIVVIVVHPRSQA